MRAEGLGPARCRQTRPQACRRRDSAQTRRRHAPDVARWQRVPLLEQRGSNRRRAVGLRVDGTRRSVIRASGELRLTRVSPCGGRNLVDRCGCGEHDILPAPMPSRRLKARAIGCVAPRSRRRHVRPHGKRDRARTTAGTTRLRSSQHGQRHRVLSQYRVRSNEGETHGEEAKEAGGEAPVSVRSLHLIQILT